MGMGFSAISQSAKQNLRVKLELTEANKKDDNWELSAIATISAPGDETVEGVEVQFYHNGSKLNQPVETEDDGRAKMELSLPNGKHTIEAQIPGIRKKGKQTITLKDDKPKKLPFRVLACPPIRAQDKIIQHFQVLAEDNNSVKGAIIRLVNSESGFTVELPETDKKGCAGIELEWGTEEKCKMLHIQILGTRITDFINIYR